jgi:riboflavin biosynthesis pyrimidine reductase
MRPVRYNVAASLDGYIAGPRGEYDWIPHDPAVDFGALFARVDTVLPRPAQLRARAGSADARVAGGRSRLRVLAHPAARGSPRGDGRTRRRRGTVAALRAEPGDGEIWLFGGGALFASLLAAGQVDAVEVSVVPVLLGGGVPLLPPACRGRCSP